MLFHSYEFILLFLPLTIILYFYLNRFSSKWGMLLIGFASLLFYVRYDWKSSWVILASIVFTWIFGKMIMKKKAIGMWCGVGTALFLLAVFKYLLYFWRNLNLLYRDLPACPNLILPLGISFFTFQEIMYLVDCRRGKVSNYTLLEYALYILYFPKVVQGPLVKAEELIRQFRDEGLKYINYDNIAAGMIRFSYGLAKKVVLADNFGKIVSFGFANIHTLSSVESAMTVLAYTLQIYLDFSGYCDMAWGVSKMMNISLPENFNSPYKSKNIGEFWDRWHITLTNFLTEYVYIPLGGSRKGNIRAYLNIMIVFLISGVWHGTGYTFLLWGFLHGAASVFDKWLKNKGKNESTYISRIVTFLFVMIAWVYFRADSVGQGTALIKQIYLGGRGGINFELAETLLQPVFINILAQVLTLQGAMAVLFMGTLFIVVFGNNSGELTKKFIPDWKHGITAFVLLIYSLLSLSGVSTFLYINF